jgi:hypothetical protein
MNIKDIITIYYTNLLIICCYAGYKDYQDENNILINQIKWQVRYWIKATNLNKQFLDQSKNNLIKNNNQVLKSLCYDISISEKQKLKRQAYNKVADDQSNFSFKRSGRRKSRKSARRKSRKSARRKSRKSARRKSRKSARRKSRKSARRKSRKSARKARRSRRKSGRKSRKSARKARRSRRKSARKSKSKL